MGLYLEHAGRPHEGSVPHSGRYPWGSGDEAYQAPGSFYKMVRELEKDGASEKELKELLGMSINEIRSRKSLDKDALRQSQIRQAQYLKDKKGYSDSKIGEIIGGVDGPISGRTINSWLNPIQAERAKVTDNIADALKQAVDEKKYIDVGPGVASYMGISDTKLKTAIQKLQDEGYVRETIYVEQAGTTHKTTMNVLAPAGTTKRDLQQNLEQIQLPAGIKFKDGGSSYWTMHYPVGIDSKRVTVRYAEDGGTSMDGVMQIRPGVQDLDLGSSHYAQVRILVGENHYLKGMAMYGDAKDFPKGVDVIFNTNKTKDVPMINPDDDGESVLKKTKKNPAVKNNPFGASIVAQNDWEDSDGTTHQGALNIVNEEGSWGKWSKTLSSQLLSKQPVSLAKQQLNKSYDEKKEEYDEIMALTNPAIKRKLLESFADDCDASAVHLKAAAMPRQASHVILPVPDMPEDKIYAPQYRDGETVVLIRYPHGGRFEIPTLTVDNKSKATASARRSIGDAIDGVGIHPKVAERLSGADFDGDTVLVIPNNEGAIKTKSPLAGLKDFNPSEAYKAYEGMPKVGPKTGFYKQRQMGEVSNLITDMTIKGASDDEIARAVRHSMVVIDAEKHNLDWRASEANEGIRALKEKYQGGPRAGASTLISRARGEERIPERRKYVKIDPDTGEKVYAYTNRSYDPGTKVVDPGTGQKVWTPSGKVKEAQTTVKRLEYHNAEELSSGTAIEQVYANYSNRMKSLGNQARKSLVSTPTQKYDPSAAKTYAEEVESLNAKLNLALKNAPLERMAQRYTASTIRALKKDNPDMDKDELKKVRFQTLAAARVRVGANKNRIQVTSKEWEAIQAGAISNNMLVKILNNTDTDVIKQYATPRTKVELTASQAAQIRAMLQNPNNTVADVANRFGVSAATIYNVAKPKE